MDHITRCPNCSTSFRVTEAQLAAFQGKVRCGKCAFVFNAKLALHDFSPAIIAEPPAPKSTPATEHPEPVETLASEPSAEKAEESVAEPEEQTQPDLIPPLHRDPTAREEDDPTALMQTTEIQAEEACPKSGTYHPIVLPEDEALFAPLPPSKHARVWRFVASLAGMILLLQILFAYRVNLIMEFPALQPKLTSLCQTLRCEMPLPRKAEQLRMEWSELTFIPNHPSLLQLSATLRNLAAYDQALPLLEITLTDSREQVVARRILRPEEYLAAGEKNRGNLLRGEELHAFLQLDMGALKSTGYSLYWFYN